MKQLRILLTDEQYSFAKTHGKLWLRDVVQFIMDHPSSDWVLSEAPKQRKWYEVWK